MNTPVRRALVSTYDKTGVVDLCRSLASRGVEIVSTGGTSRLLAEAGIPPVSVSSVTDFPEMLDGRVKMLHPRIHGGILAVRSNPEHAAHLEAHGIPPLDLVLVNLYVRGGCRVGSPVRRRRRDDRRRRPRHGPRRRQEPRRRDRGRRSRRLRRRGRGDRGPTLPEAEWQRRFAGARKAAKRALAERDTVTVLSIALSRIYVLRNQLIHGGATWNSSVNRDQVRDCVNLLGKLVLLVIETMLDSPEATWGNACYPVVE